MKKILSYLFCLTVLVGCSCSPNGSGTTSPSLSVSPSESPSETSGTQQSSSTQDYLDYLAQEYAITDPTQIQNLDSNAVEGYSFGLDNQNYYLVQLDPTNEAAVEWMNQINQSGTIEIDVDGLPTTMIARLNGNYALITNSSEIQSGFGEYYDQFTDQQSIPWTQGSQSPSSPTN